MEQPNLSRLYLVTITVVLALMLIRTCGSLASTELELERLGNTNDEFTIRIAQDSAKIYSQSQTIVSSERKYAELEKINAALGIKASQAVQYRTKTVIQTEFELGDTVYIDSFPHLRLPRSFGREGKWLSIGGTINRVGRLQIDSLIIPVSYTVAIGDTLRKGSILRKRDKVVRIAVDNPYVSVTGISNVVIRQDKKWWQTDAAKIGLGAFIGFGLTRIK
jgi:hypothetical protein